MFGSGSEIVRAAVDLDEAHAGQRVLERERRLGGLPAGELDERGVVRRDLDREGLAGAVTEAIVRRSSDFDDTACTRLAVPKACTSVVT